MGSTGKLTGGKVMGLLLEHYRYLIECLDLPPTVNVDIFMRLNVGAFNKMGNFARI